MSIRMNILRMMALGVAITLGGPAYSEGDQPAAPPQESAALPQAKIAVAERYPELAKTVSAYMDAWQKEEFDKMQGFESFEGGEDLKGFHYMQTFDAQFGLSEWQLANVQELEDDRYLVLVMIKHNPPAHVRALIPQGQKVRSTLRQYWKKQGDTYVHLFHVEKEKLMGPMMKGPEMPGAQPPKDGEKAPAEVKQDGV